MDDFHAGQPIFIQIRQRLITMILSNAVVEGDALPSVRQIAADLSVNPLTVTRAYDTLVDTGAVEKRRGLGMFVAEGARDILLAQERRTFLQEEWPRIAARIAALELDADTLLGAITDEKEKDPSDDQ
ncbi:GntR family transcriptional regulator [Devosia pacifica]|uniref:GntR family transcriptional regulator n=1 Tax=Devosia pacifica TaxID=1335967 RepID=A0A918S2T8_9HYPH|nr:GntR family transcriptional regulator [Devosia pacifica]GHA21022.1 GntR family transcriptional regulator [Devosia pacifica]